jgi:hypothetical protein
MVFRGKEANSTPASVYSLARYDITFYSSIQVEK